MLSGVTDDSEFLKEAIELAAVTVQRFYVLAGSSICDVARSEQTLTDGTLYGRDKSVPNKVSFRHVRYL